jgi:DNA primase
MATVLQLLGFRAKSTNGGQLRGACPLHGSTSGTSRCFSANVDDHVYGCFKCGRVGNALDLWSAATKQPPHDAAIDLCGRLNVSIPYLPLEAPRHREEEPVTTTEQKTSNVGDVPPILYPLTRHQASSISR